MQLMILFSRHPDEAETPCHLRLTFARTVPFLPPEYA